MLKKQVDLKENQLQYRYKLLNEYYKQLVDTPKNIIKVRQMQAINCKLQGRDRGINIRSSKKLE